MRNDYQSSGKYDSPFTAYLDQNVIGNGFEDENVGDIESSYGLTVRLGRHLLTYHTDGSVDRQSFDTSSNAEAWLDAIAKDYYANVTYFEDDEPTDTYVMDDATFPKGQAFTVTSGWSSGIVWQVEYRDGESIAAYMVGDDVTHHHDIADCTPYSDDVCSCGQAGCGWY